MKRLLLSLIRLYQRTISPDHGALRQQTLRSCKYTPTCSQYGYEAIQRHGAIRGSLLAVRRVLRCHPWARGGYDPVLPHS